MSNWENIRHIIFDADDTLWENNIYYVQAGSDFFDLISEAGFPRNEVEKEFDLLELTVVREMGYGSKNFVYILEELFKKYTRLNGKHLDSDRFRKIVDRFTEHPTGVPDLFPNVPETIEYLKGKYKLYILTKGEFAEQQGKIIRAGMNKLVSKYYIPSEKNDETYRKLIEDNGWQANETCMVGNSPKSDINPALRQGMFAIHIPYRDTWKLDNEPIESFDSRFLELEQFKDLQNIFK